MLWPESQFAGAVLAWLAQVEFARSGPHNLAASLASEQRPWQAAVVERERDLDQPGDAGGGLEVPHVRLDRADVERVARRPLLTVGAAQRQLGGQAVRAVVLLCHR